MKKKIKLLSIIFFIIFCVMFFNKLDVLNKNINKNIDKNINKNINKNIDNKFDNNDAKIKLEGSAEKIPIFTFHRIVLDDVKKEKFSDNEWAESIDVFTEQMQYLYDNNYKTLSLDELYCWYKNKCEFPKKTVVITFDDGNSEDYYLVLPVLKKFKFKATSFIVGSRTYEKDTSYDKTSRSFITKDIIKKTEMEYPYLQYQSHSWDMHNIDSNGKERILNYSKEKLEEDFRKNDYFGFKYMAYPYGVYKNDVFDVLEEHDYLLAFTFRKHDYATRDSYKYEIPRIKINGFSSVEDIKKWLNY